MDLIPASLASAIGIVLLCIWARKRLLCRTKITARVDSILTKELPDFSSKHGPRHGITIGYAKKTWYRPILRYEIDGSTYTSVGDEWTEFNFRYHVGQQNPLLVCANNPALCTQPNANHFRNVGLVLSSTGILAISLMLYSGNY